MQFLEHTRRRLAVLENDRDVDRASIVSRHLNGDALGCVGATKARQRVDQVALQLQHAVNLAGSHGDNLLDHATVDGKRALVVDVDLGACLLNRVAGRGVAFGGVLNQLIVSLGLFKSSLVFVVDFNFCMNLGDILVACSLLLVIELNNLNGHVFDLAGLLVPMHGLSLSSLERTNPRAGPLPSRWGASPSLP